MIKDALLFLFLFLLFASAHAIENDHIIPPVVVTRSPNDTASSGPHSLITQTEITQSGTTTLAQTLQDLGGVSWYDLTGSGHQVLLTLRGFGANASSNTLLLINGIPLRNPDMAPPDLNVVPLDDIRYIEIISGSESVLYGDQAVGGVINIITQPQTKKKTVIDCYTGSYHQAQCEVSIQNHFREVDYHLFVSHQRTDNYRQHNANLQNSVSANISRRYQNGHFHIDFMAMNENLQYPGALTAAEVRQNRRQANNTSNFFKDTNGILQLRHFQSFNDAWLLDTALSHREMHGNGVLSSGFTQSRTQDSVRPQLKGTWHSLHLIGGVEWQRENYFLNGAAAITEASLVQSSLYGLADLPLSHRFHISAGWRGAQQSNHLHPAANERLHQAFASTVGGTIQLTPTLQAFLRRAGSYRFPKTDELASTLQHSTPLRVQRGTAYEAGLSFHHGNESGKIEVFQLNLKDEIAFDPTQTAADPFGTNSNLDPTERRGISISGKKMLSPTISLSSQYHYIDARFHHGIYTGNRIPLVAEHIANMGLHYQINEHWSEYAEAVFTGNQYADNDNANIAGKIGGYTVYHFNLRYQYKELSASLHLNNIFNKDYYLYTVYQPSLQSEFFYPAPVRSIVLSVSYRL